MPLTNPQSGGHQEECVTIPCALRRVNMFLQDTQNIKDLVLQKKNLLEITNEATAGGERSALASVRDWLGGVQMGGGAKDNLSNAGFVGLSLTARPPHAVVKVLGTQVGLYCCECWDLLMHMYEYVGLLGSGNFV